MYSLGLRLDCWLDCWLAWDGLIAERGLPALGLLVAGVFTGGVIGVDCVYDDCCLGSILNWFRGPVEGICRSVRYCCLDTFEYSIWLLMSIINLL